MGLNHPQITPCLPSSMEKLCSMKSVPGGYQKGRELLGLLDEQGVLTHLVFIKNAAESLCLQTRFEELWLSQASWVLSVLHSNKQREWIKGKEQKLSAGADSVSSSLNF